MPSHRKTLPEKCQAGDWIQICVTILPSFQRAPQVPSETQAVPLDMYITGFAQSDAEIGQSVSLRTLIGRTYTGELISILPRYTHDFGDPVPELLTIGLELRRMLEDQGSPD